MKNLLLIFACAALFGLTVSAQSKPLDPPKALDDYFPELWKTYEFKEDKFKIRLPGKPTEALETANLPGQFVRKNVIKCVGVVWYAIIVFGLNEDVEKRGSADKAIEFMKSTVSANLKIVKEEKISVASHPGKFLQVEADPEVLQRYKIIVVDDHVYVLLATSGRTAPNVMGSENDFEKIAMTFLDSFEPIS